MGVDGDTFAADDCPVDKGVLPADVFADGTVASGLSVATVVLVLEYKSRT